MKALIDQLEYRHELSREEWIMLLQARSPELEQELFSRARAVRRRYYGDRVFIRGLIEFTNHCKNDCYYCGLRRSISICSGTGFPLRKSLPAAGRVTTWDTGPLCCRAGKIRPGPRIELRTW